MKLRSYVFVAAAMFATFAVAFDETSDFKAGIQKEMAKYVAAIKAKDVAGMEKVLRANFAPEFKDTDKTGRVTKLQQTIASMKANIAGLKSVQSAILKVESAKVANGKATTTEHFILKATIGSMDPKNPKKTSKLSVDSQWTATYVKRNGKWQCLSSKTIKETDTIDGHKIG